METFRNALVWMEHMKCTLGFNMLISIKLDFYDSACGVLERLEGLKAQEAREQTVMHQGRI